MHFETMQFKKNTTTLDLLAIEFVEASKRSGDQTPVPQLFFPVFWTAINFIANLTRAPSVSTLDFQLPNNKML